MTAIAEMLGRPEFRGLWHSRTMFGDGHLEDGWSVTFVADGNYCETPYQMGPEAAARYALELLDRVARPCVAGTVPA